MRGGGSDCRCSRSSIWQCLRQLSYDVIPCPVISLTFTGERIKVRHLRGDQRQEDATRTTNKETPPCATTAYVPCLNAGKPTLGTHLLSTWPTLVELVGQAGNYDYVEFTAEYSPFDMHDLDNLGRALELKDLGGMIKIEQTQWTHQAMRAIGSGFQSVLFADLRTVADAHACVAAVRAETPGTGGRLGVGMRRDVGTVSEGGSPAYVEALNEVVIAVMVEKRECVEDLDAILSVKGIDMVQFGGSDYSMSMGLTGPAQPPRCGKRPNVRRSRRH